MTLQQPQQTAITETDHAPADGAAHRKLVLVSAAALIDADNRILIQKRTAAQSWAGYWEFPGGKIEAGETPEQALVRELHEELEITTVEKALFPLGFMSYSYPDCHVLVPLFGCRNWTGLPQARLGQELAWVRAPRLGDYNLLPSNLPVIASLCQLV